MSEKNEKILRAAPIRESSEGLTHATTTEGRTMQERINTAITDSRCYTELVNMLRAIIEIPDGAETEPRPNGPFSPTYRSGRPEWLTEPICPQCGESLQPDDERVSVEWCSSCGERCIITPKQVTLYATEIEGMKIGRAPEPASAETKK